MKFKKVIALSLVFLMAVGLFAGCGSKKEEGDDKGSVYYLNFKPEVSKQWETIAKEYEDETGVKVKVSTAASGQYETTLKSEIAKKEPPTLFQINGPIGYKTWSAYCMDLKDTDFYKNLSDPSLAVTDGDGVYGIPYVVEGFGIIYNDAIMQQYFALADKAVSIGSADEIQDFDTLKAVAEDMTKHKEELGIDGVFSSTSFSPGEDWRWQTHLANVPIFYEYKDNDTNDMDKIEFSYNKEYKNLFDLYLNNSTVEPGLVGSKTVNDSMAEFALGKSAMVQNGNWGWGQVTETDGYVVKAEDVKFMPLYTGTDDDKDQGLCLGTENYFCVNEKASDADKQATLDFMNWLVTSEKGKKFMIEDMGFIMPFSTFDSSEQPEDPLAQQIAAALQDDSKTVVNWVFTTFPSQTFKDDFGASLLEYAQGNKEWDDVVSDMTASWASEKEAIAD
ncbi:raffinose/stachyose/melibiose transport system substrate-binding protein [Lachnospiraceae bacterium PM6-15]|uniref:ABC transporter substrate-binding protein n=1 Tax=Ohessyouella blattaphilus TaxID=2949333 RepID=UPI003E30F22B